MLITLVDFDDSLVTRVTVKGNLLSRITRSVKGAGSSINSRDFTSAGTDGGPGNQCDNHGTTVAGCTSAIINNGLGVVGIAPGAKIAAAKYSISNVPCDGSGWFYISWFVNALDWAQTIGARVTNCSSGFGSNSSITSKYQQT